MKLYCVAIASTRIIQCNEMKGDQINATIDVYIHSTPAVVYAETEAEATIKGYEIAQDRYPADSGHYICVNVIEITNG